MPPSGRLPIPGSERRLVPGHVRVGEIDLGEPLTVSAYLGVLDAPARAALEAFAAAHGIRLADGDPARRRVRLTGSTGALATAFGTRWEGRYAPSDTPGARSYRARSGPLTVPAELAGLLTGVFGFDDRPQARPHIRFAAAGASAYAPPEVASAYAFPSGGTAGAGAGHTVAIVELGGGYAPGDLDTYFTGLGITAPTVRAIAVDGGANDPGADTDADGEVCLDIEVIGSIIPHATIDVYFAANTDQGFLDAVSQAVHATPAPTAVSVSWGSSEDGWTAQARTQMETILTEAGTLGVTVTVAAGDGGSSDGVSGGGVHVDFPASAPHALGCGGTTLTLREEAITAETVWDSSGGGATGGGVSDVFALPTYQDAAKVPDNADTGRPGRGVPDVAGDADPQTGYAIRVDGTAETVGGTSAVAPLWAALLTLLAQELGTPLGFAQPRLYPLLGRTAFHDITQGSNGAYAAGPGWDACTGLGTPDGAALLAALRGGA